MDFLQNDLLPAQNKVTANYILVTDWPSQSDLKDRELFSGVDATSFNRLCSSVRFPIHKCFITSCVKTPVDKKQESLLYNAKGFKCAQWYELRNRLIEDLSEITADIIILMGSLSASLFFDDTKFIEMSKHRGSVYYKNHPSIPENLSSKIFVVTEHIRETSLYRDPLMFYPIAGDLDKAMRLFEDPTLCMREMNLIVNPTHNRVLSYLKELNEVETSTSVDIECTPKFITCIAFTHADESAISVPFINNYGNMWTIQDEIAIWDLIAQILDNPSIDKIAQNGMFDFMFILRTMGIKTNNFAFDTMLAQHICYTDLSKGLDFLVAQYLYLPYHKDEGKQSHLKLIKDWDAYWTYNAKDALTTLWCMQELSKEVERKKVQNDFSYMMELHKPLMEIEYKGIQADKEGIVKFKQKYEKYIKVLTKVLYKIMGQEINHTSPKQLCAYFYGTLQIKPYINKKSGNPTTDVVALSRIAKKKIKGSFEAKIILKLRKFEKLVNTYLDVPLDEDNRLRCQHKITGTETGRISTEKTFFGTGMNLQNQPPKFKKFLITDPGYLMIEFDLAKAEAHLVAYLCQDENMIRVFNEGIDVHTMNAHKIFKIPMDKVTKQMRDLGKRVVHASNYKMGPGTFSDNLATKNIFMSLGECRDLLNAYAEGFPKLARWHKEVEKQLVSTRTIYNLFGRPKEFLGPINDHIIRAAIAYSPQSTIGELMNRSMIKVYNDPWYLENDIHFFVTVHDSVGFRIPIKEKDNTSFILDFCLRTKQHLTHVFNYKSHSFSIGVDAKISNKSWGDLKEIKEFSMEGISNAIKIFNLE